MLRHSPIALAVVLCGVTVVACGGEEESSGGRRPGGAGAFGGFGQAAAPAAVPVETVAAERRDISAFLEINGTLEAENEVDVVARVAAPIVELAAEEGMAVQKGQILARLDQDELRARVEISRVALEEAELAFRRAEELNAGQLISIEEYEQARNRFETARAPLEGDQLQIDYTTIRAPFAGLIVTRYVDFAEQVAVNAPLFRLSDFDPLLCPIQVPERDLGLLRIGQPAFLQVEAWGEEKFEARVLRISPVVDAATGTIKVTLEVSSRGKLRPGMFARAALETASKENALVIPKAALSLESIGDTVYVANGGSASRREVELGFQEGDTVEVLTGLSEGDQVIVVGQDGLSDGTPIQVLSGPGAEETRMASNERTREPATGEPGPATADPSPLGSATPSSRSWAGGSGMMNFDPSQATPEQLERVRAMMRSRGLSDQEIDERLERMRERGQRGDS